MTGAKQTFIEILTWRPIEDRGFDDDECLLVQHADGEICGAWLDGGQWRNLDAAECPEPVLWAHWPMGTNHLPPAQPGTSPRE